jgi:hypothetical protein
LLYISVTYTGRLMKTFPTNTHTHTHTQTHIISTKPEIQKFPVVPRVTCFYAIFPPDLLRRF